MVSQISHRKLNFSIWVPPKDLLLSIKHWSKDIILRTLLIIRPGRLFHQKLWRPKPKGEYQKTSESDKYVLLWSFSVAHHRNLLGLIYNELVWNIELCYASLTTYLSQEIFLQKSCPCKTYRGEMFS